MKRIAILTSGGDAPGMNAVIRAVVRSAIYMGYEVYGVKNGYEGLIDGDIVQLIESSVADIIQRGGTILGTSRSKRFETDEGLDKAVNILEVFGIDKLIVAGGDGSLRGALALAGRGIDVIGIPLSIDNDLGYTDYTIGFFTAIDTVTHAISNIRDTTEAHGRANIVEVMGRNCGDIALYSGLSGGAESIIVPERKFDMEEISKKAILGKNRGKRHHIIILAEGAGDAYKIAEEFEKLTGIDTRVTILGYIQRGGNPNVVDRIMGAAMGNAAVEYIISNSGAYAVGICSGKIEIFNLEIALNIKKEFKDDLSDILKKISI
ncbi:ATP-dependent 6-phosphofructokinase [Peptoniphilus sp. oral taxon 386]|uniref:ATP-dependent 6-phosphofructokinase n=1 Tax=Peptoniphilus sp. oral taxon 386 TaxID=652713 RepID=UPI0001DA9AD1|nr:ATP-dependent 6-phosphofructokinase [Peptoniphilus sp. oral taxon 386]EFI42027.1 6-phosphofructokinase isozyme 1 [Peptoniphilus sp. oral taxon 386 str. F0131]